MKIAFVGKGGSGKSSVSWLAIKTLEDMGVTVLAIDADHNMDLTSNLGLDPESTVLMRTTDKEFMEKTLNSCDGNCDGHENKHEHRLPTFSFDDDYTKSITTPVSKNLKLINIGLGSPDVLFTSTCAHGLSGPLKYYLGLLDEKDSWVIIDSVAGADMLNYGLYSGIDAVIGIVEPHRNSIKVFEQIQDICRKTMIPCYAIMNRPADNEFYTHFKNEFKTITLGEIPFDIGIVAYNYQSIENTTKTAMKTILEKIKNLKRRGGLQTV
jgi:CO dehydrogenase nickel-insertion accessory protein CooC1